MDQRYYRQVVGIPQGSVLSSLLCSFCYGDLETNKLGEFSSPDDTQNVSGHCITFFLLLIYDLSFSCFSD